MDFQLEPVYPKRVWRNFQGHKMDSQLDFCFITFSALPAAAQSMEECLCDVWLQRVWDPGIGASRAWL